MVDYSIEYTQYVQAKFFRTGLYTHLYLTTVPDGDGLKAKWIFTFQDLGSSHTLSREVSLTLSDASGEICIDGVGYPTLAQAEDALFSGYYAAYVRDLYQLEGVSA